jgi:hypothetical protein
VTNPPISPPSESCDLTRRHPRAEHLEGPDRSRSQDTGLIGITAVCIRGLVGRKNDKVVVNFVACGATVPVRRKVEGRWNAIPIRLHELRHRPQFFFRRDEPVTCAAIVVLRNAIGCTAGAGVAQDLCVGRYRPADEIGWFELTDSFLEGLADPSRMGTTRDLFPTRTILIGPVPGPAYRVILSNLCDDTISDRRSVP